MMDKKPEQQDETIKSVLKAWDREDRFMILQCPLMEQALRRADLIVDLCPELREEVKAIHARMCLIYFEQLMAISQKARKIIEERNK